MKKIMLFIGFLLFAAAVQGQVIITEVLYDPSGTETGGEFVELFNPTGNTIAIGGWQLATKSSETDVTFPSQSAIRPHAYFLVADKGWNLSMDMPGWPLADHEEAMTLTNDDAGVALKNNGTIIDAVGWGDPESLYEYNASPMAREGYSLSRKKIGGSYADTDNNAMDFFEAPAEPQNSSSTTLSSGEMTFEIIVVNTTLSLERFNFPDDDLRQDGFQIAPLPGGFRRIPFTAIALSNAGNPSVSITFRNQSLPILNITQLDSARTAFTSQFEMAYHEQPGNYTLSILLSDANGQSSGSAAFFYMPMAALAIDTVNISLGNAAPGSEITIIGDSDVATKDKPTITNMGNTNLDIKIQPKDQFSLDNLFYNLTGIFTPLVVDSFDDINLSSSAVQPLSLKFLVPPNASAGIYKSSIIIHAISS